MTSTADPPILKSSVLGSITEVCIVTGDLYKTAAGLLRLGIGPFQVFDFNPTTVSKRSFRGQPGDFELKVAFAKQGALVFELMQPTRGNSLMQEYLDTHGGKEGIQHIAFDLQDLPLEERKQKMKERGFEVGMEGVWEGKRGKCEFVFFDTLASTGTIFETIIFSHDWEDPPCEWFPAQGGLLELVLRLSPSIGVIPVADRLRPSSVPERMFSWQLITSIILTSHHTRCRYTPAAPASSGGSVI